MAILDHHVQLQDPEVVSLRHLARDNRGSQGGRRSNSSRMNTTTLTRRSPKTPSSVTCPYHHSHPFHKARDHRARRKTLNLVFSLRSLHERTESMPYPLLSRSRLPLHHPPTRTGWACRAALLWVRFLQMSKSLYTVKNEPSRGQTTSAMKRDTFLLLWLPMHRAPPTSKQLALHPVPRVQCTQSEPT